MSSTNRGGDRHASDYYITPEKDVRLFLSHFLTDEGIDRPDRLHFLDCCAGGDKDHGMAYAGVIEEEFDPQILDTMDIREDSRAEKKCDFLKEPVPSTETERYDVVISNPPFVLAEEFVRRSLEWCRDGGYVIMLLRLNFFGSVKRFPLFKEHLPIRCYVHHKRISFTEDGVTDSVEYAHFVWKKGTNPKFTKLNVI